MEHSQNSIAGSIDEEAEITYIDKLLWSDTTPESNILSEYEGLWAYVDRRRLCVAFSALHTTTKPLTLCLAAIATLLYLEHLPCHVRPLHSEST